MPAVVVCMAGTLLAGCESMPTKVAVDFPPLPPAPSYPAPALVPSAAAFPNGSLYQQATYRPGFEDRRARLVGDALTVVIVENVSASQKSSSTADRASTLSAGVSAFPFLSSGTLGRLSAEAETGNTFSGKGGTDTANTFSGSITTTVVEVLPNGHLLVAGEKQIGLNQNVDVLRFTGTVDPRAIQPGSIVNSSQVANVRVESRGRGPQAEAQIVGILARFFMSFWPF